MKAALVIVVLIALSQTAFARQQFTRSRVHDCLEELRGNLVEHVYKLGEWGEKFLLSITVAQKFIQEHRDFCDSLIYNDPPTYFEELLFNMCIEENDKIADLESERIRSELEDKVYEQPELLKSYLNEFRTCLTGVN